MNIEFTGPAINADDGGVLFRARVDGVWVRCHFTYEALQDIDPTDLQMNPMAQFERHRALLLSLAEDKILKGHLNNNLAVVYTGDINPIG
ncbi:DUF1488 family protein [Polynucleobacter sp. P1-05-14]|uniref:DUF1488 family protein n=1 Tax=Polynucleobacter sp. P1-05-14 TaxID=1819732 RepID=UPI001C0C626E|nr:DUF1488 family protein [Polynucleobacter sp. P1-05-14]MBU3548116.1 DUF1488 domain-containing protein [Polynucleobacter sp. P1-05-14]